MAKVGNTASHQQHKAKQMRKYLRKGKPWQILTSILPDQANQKIASEMDETTTLYAIINAGPYISENIVEQGIRSR